MTRPGFAILALFAVLPATAGCIAVDKINVRQAACLPVLSAGRGFYFSGSTGLSLQRDDTPLPEQIAALRKLLKIDPANAEVYNRLGAIYAEVGNQKDSEEVYAQAAEVCRGKLAQHPDDIPSRLMLAEALQGHWKYDEAEALLRQLVKDVPENWRCWLGLAEFLGSMSFAVIMNRVVAQ
jgi:cytochrome c-type biogenesis protein CcmH/NrfG